MSYHFGWDAVLCVSTDRVEAEAVAVFIPVIVVNSFHSPWDLNKFCSLYSYI